MAEDQEVAVEYEVSPCVFGEHWIFADADGKPHCIRYGTYDVPDPRASPQEADDAG
jgi:hypothetical protein